MNAKRQIEIFSAGCPLCEDTIALVNELACPSCEITVHDMHRSDGAERARALGVQSVPAVAIDGKLAQGAMDTDTLRAAGVGQPLA
ncbi:MAG: thioredoxin family protein [Gammaproteobacteria bacterium]|nr:thioredoxin family protein [Gammaproteobacteria bacterium]